MKIKPKDIEEYIQNIPKEKKEVFTKLMDVIRTNIPEGFSK